VRCQIDESAQWHFVCPGACWKSVSGGVEDAKGLEGQFPWYRYGGMVSSSPRSLMRLVEKEKERLEWKLTMRNSGKIEVQTDRLVRRSLEKLRRGRRWKRGRDRMGVRWRQEEVVEVKKERLRTHKAVLVNST
jgi:hypothetical protein